MVDAERLRAILRRIASDVEVLRGYAAMDRRAILDSPERLGHLKYLFVTAIEGCSDAAQHVCASERWGMPDDNGHAMRILSAQGVCDEELAESMARAVGFRNVLIHGYRTVDDGVVVDNLNRLADLDAFVAALADLV